MRSNSIKGLARALAVVVLGGCATIAVATITGWKAPRRRRLDLRDLN